MIVGAGLAGLIASHAFPRVPIIEAQPEPRSIHKALLRFRGTEVADLVGIPFRPVTVHKGIWLDGRWVAPNIQVANLYSRKVLGRLADRSIWRLNSETRFIAPEDLYERLVDAQQGRIQWGTQANFRDDDGPVISTAPMPVVLRAMNIHCDEEFARSPVHVERFRLPNADVYQTVYFPTPDHSLYRASITGSMLICEFTGPRGDNDLWLRDVERAFALPQEKEWLEAVDQRYGKIAPIDEGTRRALISRLTDDWGVYSLGRFATWRNILLDDVVNDIAVIKKLINASAYDRRLAR